MDATFCVAAARWTRMADFPLVLKPIVGLVKQAQTLQKPDPVLSYYGAARCHRQGFALTTTRLAVLLWAAQKGMAIRASNNTPEVTSAILGLLDQIEAVSASASCVLP